MGGSGIEYEMNCPSGMSPRPLSENALEMTLDSVSILKSSVGADIFISSSFGASAPSASLCEFSSSLENEGVKSTSHLLHNPSSLSFNMFGSGNFSEMVGSFGFLTEGDQSQIANIKCPFSYVQNLNAGGSEEERAIPKNDAKAQPDCDTSSSPNEKRRKLALGSNSSSSNKNAEGNLNVEPFVNVTEILKKDDKTLKVENRMCANFNNKSDGKQAKESSQSVQAPKENYIHVRARRGRATNSHSLTERVRREKISERMKLLQKLVPGCNQITGKTVVLDEIINYIQSLQQQVEFLSMTLAIVSPKSNLDTEQIVVKDNLYISSSKIDPRFTTSHTTSHPMFQLHGTIPTMPRTSHQLSSLSKMKR